MLRGAWNRGKVLENINEMISVTKPSVLQQMLVDRKTAIQMLMNVYFLMKKNEICSVVPCCSYFLRAITIHSQLTSSDAVRLLKILTERIHSMKVISVLLVIEETS